VKLKLYYDGDCPFCSKYADILRLCSCYDLEVCNAREDLSYKECSKDIELDDGVILRVDKSCFQGVEALDMLLKICKFKGVFFGLHKIVFANGLIGNGVYAFFKWMRRVALYLKKDHSN